jgi:uncharacterized membrane protein SirB2
VTTYELLKTIHVSCVVLSGSGFFARGLLMLNESPLLTARLVRIAPHVIDTGLLASAIAMAWLARLSPLAHPWLGAKIIALLVYIGIGMVALKRGRTRRVRVTAFVAALTTFGYIVSVALTRQAVPWL